MYDPKNGHKSAKMVVASVGGDGPYPGQSYILILNKVNQINFQANHLIYLRKCGLNDVHINEVCMFLTDSPNPSTHAIQVKDPLGDVHPLTASLK